MKIKPTLAHSLPWAQPDVELYKANHNEVMQILENTTGDAIREKAALNCFRRPTLEGGL